MPDNYCVYALFSKRETEILNAAAQALQERYAEHVKPSKEGAHITCAYGPELSDGEAEIVDACDVAKVLGRVPWVADMPMIAEFHGVSHFDRRAAPFPSFVIKAEFEAPQLTAVRTAVWDEVPSMEARRAKAEAELRAAGDEGDMTYRKHAPLRWAHATLAIFKADTDPNILLRAEEYARELLAAAAFPTAARIETVALMTARTWTAIPLFVNHTPI